MDNTNVELETLFASVFRKRIDFSRIAQLTRKFGIDTVLDRLNYLLNNPPYITIDNPYKYLWRICEKGVSKTMKRTWK